MDSSGNGGKPKEPPAEPGRVSLLGHDLRAAMSDVIGGLRLIDERAIDDKARLQLQRVRASSEALARLIEEELIPLQGDVGFDERSSGNVQVARMLHDLQVRWEGRAQEKGLGWRMVVAPDLPRVISVDRLALERVASNILSNALKFTDHGEVRVLIDMHGQGLLRLRVEDDGPGFSASALQGLFQIGVRPDGRGKPGQGFGLRISRDMMMRLGGTIEVTNRPEGGALITVLVPCTAWTPPAIGQDSEPGLPDLSQIRVLVADDSLTNQAVVGNMLAAMGAEYETASDGVEVMNWLDRERFDILLLDIEMPRMSGFDVLREVRRPHHPLVNLPILAISAYVLRANREAIYLAGANGIVAKPVMDIQTFGLSLRRLLGRSAAAIAVSKTGPMPQTGFTLNEARFRSLMQISGPIGALELLRRLTNDLQQVERGVISALADENLAELRAQTHILVSVAGAVGAEDLQAMAQTLNDLAHQGISAETRRFGTALLPELDRLIHFIAQELSDRLQDEP